MTESARIRKSSTVCSAKPVMEFWSFIGGEVSHYAVFGTALTVFGDTKG